MPQQRTNFQEILQKTAQSEKSIVREHLIFQALTKISRYRAECAAFEHKYRYSLEDMQERAQQTQSENFSLEDDLLDWEYASASLHWWQNCLQELRCAD